MTATGVDALARLRFVAQQLGEFRARAERDGFAVPFLLEAAYTVASGRLPAPEVPSTADGAQAYCMTYTSAATRLGVSERTVDRLVAAGDLPTVDVGGCARIRTTDLEAYVEALQPRSRV